MSKHEHAASPINSLSETKNMTSTANANTSNSIGARFGSGAAVKRVEDDLLLKGQGNFTDDIAPAEQLRLCFLRSPHPHAKLLKIDTVAASAMPGVVAIYTGADLVNAGVKAIPSGGAFKRADGTPAASAPRRALAFETVRYVGEAIVMVIAHTMQQARDAAEAVFVDYEPLAAAVTVADAMASGAPVLCDQAPDNICAEMRHGSVAATDAAFAQAAHVVSLDISNQRLAALSIEPRSVLAWTTPQGRLSINMSTQMPSGVKTSLCNDVLGLPADQVRVTVGDVGGGFGMKTGIYPEDAAVAWSALQLKKPVKWIADRSEEFLSSAHGRDLHTKAQLALAADGKILGLRVHSMANIGAYGITTSIAITLMIGPWVQTSVYDIQTIDFHFKAVLTNTASTSAYRGAGRPEAIYTMERLVDEAARQTGIDRLALRRRNFIQPTQMPYKNPMGQIYDCGRFEYVMDQGLALADWKGFDQRAARSKANGKLRGLGIATFLEWTGGNSFEETVTVNIQADGIIEVFAAVNAMGQGIATTLAQLVVDVFDVAIDQVRVVLGDTDRGSGFGSAASRSIFTGGSALQRGSEQTLAHAKTLAAKELEASAQDIVYQSGVFSIPGTDIRLSLFDLAKKQSDQKIFMSSTSAVAGPTWPNACHVTEIELDAQTGHIEVVAYHSVNDIGRVINPMIAIGQLDGGALQGIGQALYEKVVYDEQTGQLLTGSLMDYAAPRADAMSCEFKNEMDQTIPTGNNPLGAKGVGELGTIGATPAIVNAVADALSRTGSQKHLALTKQLQMPLTAGTMWQLIQG
jgi:aerobic carbon-monoxide dehydrogenase large subunit